MWRRPDVLVDVLGAADGETVESGAGVISGVTFVVGAEGDTLVSVLAGDCVELGSNVESGADVLGVASLGVVAGVISVESAGVCVVGVVWSCIGCASVESAGTVVESLGVSDASVDVFDCGVVIRRSLFGVMLGF